MTDCETDTDNAGHDHLPKKGRRPRIDVHRASDVNEYQENEDDAASAFLSPNPRKTRYPGISTSARVSVGRAAKDGHACNRLP